MTGSIDRRAAAAKLAALTLLPCTGRSEGMPSEPVPATSHETAETVVAFDTAAHLDEARREWVVPLHLWVYRPQHSVVRKAFIARLLERTYGLKVAPEQAAVFDRRVNLLLADNLGNRRPQATLVRRALLMPATGSNGHTMREARLPVADDAPPHGGRATLSATGARQTAQVRLVPPEGLSIVSDIDDTVKATGVLDKAALWRATLLEPFKAVPGMADLFRRVGGGTAAVHFVSSSPWHLYEPLHEWLAAEGFAASALHLKQMRLKDRTILDIAKSPAETKPPVIAGLLRRYPRRRFILIGDSGEKDPEVYGDIARAFPRQIDRILIRRAPGDRLGEARFAEAFAGLPANRWHVFDDPATVV